LTCFYLPSIVFVLASVRQKNVGVINGVVCESFIEETNVVPTAVNDDCGAGKNTCLNDGQLCLVDRSATGAKQVSPIPAQHQQRTMQLRATCLNYTFAC